MTEQENREALARVFDVEAGSLTNDTRLDDLAWDSMAMLTVMAISKRHGKGMTGQQVREAKTVGDILAYL